MLRRILWHVNRTPAARAIKLARRFGARAEIAQRSVLGQMLPRTPASSAVALELRRNGYAKAESLFDAASIRMFDEASRAKVGFRPKGNSGFGEHKDIMLHLLDGDMVDGSLPADNPFVRFALQEPLLAALAECYGELPRLDYISLIHSRPTEGPLRFSQLWHRDYDDTKVIKLFVYLSDVGEEDGPFTFIPGPVSDRVSFSHRSHRTDSDIARSIDLGHAVRMVGARLSAFLVETSRCLHMGSRVAPGHERLMYMASFISAPRIFPERERPFFRLAGTESAVERRVLHPG